MSKSQPLDHDELIQRISRDLADSYDEELEMEVEDHHPLPDAPVTQDAAEEKEYRRQYFRQLFRLQAELVKLQDIRLRTIYESTGEEVRVALADLTLSGLRFLEEH